VELEAYRQRFRQLVFSTVGYPCWWPGETLMRLDFLRKNLAKLHIRGNTHMTCRCCSKDSHEEAWSCR